MHEEQHIAKQVDELIAQMTLDEKLAQLGSIWSYEVLEGQAFSPKKAEALLHHGIGQITRIGGATNLDARETARVANQIQEFLLTKTRLRIPAIVHEESCSGYMAKGATCFPQTIGIASSFDTELAMRIGEVIRDQMRAAGAQQALAPLLDVTRDPRWGRVEETFGEDPYLVSQMGIAYVRGLQGDDLCRGVAATGKHFVGYGASEGGMNWAPAHIPPRELREVYLHPFEAVVKEAKIASIMPGYHELDGIPCHSSRELLHDILRREWGFDGIVVSDYFAIANLFEYHRVASTREEAARYAVACGVDVELPSRDIYHDALRRALEQGLVSLEDVERLVRRVLTMKFRLGLFDNPFVDPDAALAVFDTPAQRALAREAAQKSIVLLKNDGDLLPLSKSLRRIAVLGPNADTIRNLVGDYAYPCHIETLLEMKDDANVFHTAMPDDIQAVDQFVPMTTILAAIREKVSPQTEVVYAKGCDILGDDDAGIPEAVAAAQGADVAIVIVGDKAGLTDDCTTGEARDRATLGLLGQQERLVREVVATGTPTVVVLVSGRPLAVTWIAEHVPAVLAAWLPGEEGAQAVADVLFGDYNPAGRLPITVPRTAGQVPVFYAHKPSGGRSHWKGAYVDTSNLPLYPFGHGLSYTRFAYRDLAVTPETVGATGQVEVSCVVENVGPRAGEEVVQLYVHDVAASVTRPVLELRGFCRVALAPGEAKRVTFTLDVRQLGFYDRNMRYIVEPGEVEVHIGASSADLRLTGRFTIRGDGPVACDKVFTTKVKAEPVA
ncbi:beta-glucosidase [Alicyclobacillus cellulosilyticus]|uniref:Beta-glucosidase n=1 Tax=Alicyclobacillus cellulosilyticus TaxID=1003997 RepID=A0A917KE29_9BACL|nr:glycoside hydrolase family 3 N-terminal domain-containing protein [Alicyclobacillus cellulosilyticus]GGJ10741.1 beta-glucosidase [Alicyclobacillus cellulosilyticus]